MVSSRLEDRAGVGARRWRGAALALLLLAQAAISLAPARADKPWKVVTAEGFVLRDSRGNVWAVLGASDSGPSLTMFDQKGIRRARLALSAAGLLTLSVVDQQGKSRVVVRVPP